MTRYSLNHYTTKLLGGINENADATTDQCAEAWNVWAPDGKVVSRPGCVGVNTLARSLTTVAGSQYVYMPTTTVGTYWYYGQDNKPAAQTGIELIDTNGPPVANQTATYVTASYYSTEGTWKYLPVVELINGSATTETHLSEVDTGTYMGFVPPNDWEVTTINSQSAYWIRFRIMDNAIAGGLLIAGNGDHSQDEEYLHRAGIAAFTTGRRFWVVQAKASDPLSLDSYTFPDIESLPTVTDPTSISSILHSTGGVALSSNSALRPLPLGPTVVPDAQEAFMATGSRVLRLRGNALQPELATTDTSDAAIGSGAPYDASQIAALSAFPDCDFIEYHSGHLWMASMSESWVRWGGAAPYHRVLPTVNIEYLAEADDSTVTGMKPLGEHMIVYKQDSIWRMVYLGLSDFSLPLYAATLIVKGKGCIAPGSLVAIGGQHIFLAEDGVYTFNGQGIKKLSDKISTTLAKALKTGDVLYASAISWTAEDSYLLSLPILGVNTDRWAGGDDDYRRNYLTVVYNYRDDTWWMWDGFDVQQWFKDEADDIETLYYVNTVGQIHRFGTGYNDHGWPIQIRIKTSRFGKDDNVKKRVRQVELTSTNVSRDCYLKVICNDAPETADTTLIDFTESAEKDWVDTITYGTDSWATERVRARRSGRRDTCDWFQLILNAEHLNDSFDLRLLDVGVMQLGRR